MEPHGRSAVSAFQFPDYQILPKVARFLLRVSKYEGGGGEKPSSLSSKRAPASLCVSVCVSMCVCVCVCVSVCMLLCVIECVSAFSIITT